MAWKREGDTVTITLTGKQYELLMLALALNIQRGMEHPQTGDPATGPWVRPWRELSMAINEGNPEFRDAV